MDHAGRLTSGSDARATRYAVAGVSREHIVDAEWRIVDGVLGNVPPVYRYKPGSWGPDEADQLVGQDGRWLNPKPA